MNTTKRFMGIRLGAGGRCLWRIAASLVIGLAAVVFPLTAQETFDNVVIVLDASGSMTQSMKDQRTVKMDAAKQAIQAVLKTVPQSTRVGLLVFSAANLDEDWVYPLGPRDDGVLFERLNRIRPGTSTPLGAYIKKGADRLLKERAAQYGYGSYRLLIVTDGEANDGELVERYTPEVMARGITMDVIGVAMSSNHTLATKVHSYRRADDPESLQRAIREVFAEVGGTTATVAQADAFEWLEPIPLELAASMIQALSSSGNQPIGSRPVAMGHATDGPSTAALASDGDSGHAVPPKTVTARGVALLPIILGVLLVLGVFGLGLLIVVAFIVKASRRRHR